MMDRSFKSLAKTNTADLETPIIQLVHRPPFNTYIQYVTELQKNWVVISDEDKPGIFGINMVFGHFGDKLLNENPDVTHIGFLVDDFVYNPEWLRQLTNLIIQHPDGIAWSVYRSRYTRHHWIIDGTVQANGDCLMSMHDCLGVMTREEWFEYGASKKSDFTCPASLGGGSTIDIYHAASRPGNRWATGRDYMENLGRHRGIEQLDCAIDFVGE